MEELSKKIVDNIRKIIAERNLKQSAVGDMANISESQFSRVLKGQVQLSLNQLANIASGLGLRAIDIITYPEVYVSQTEREDNCPEVLLQLKLRKEKKNQVFKLLFGDNDIDIINK